MPNMWIEVQVAKPVECDNSELGQASLEMTGKDTGKLCVNLAA